MCRFCNLQGKKRGGGIEKEREREMIRYSIRFNTKLEYVAHLGGGGVVL